MPVLFEDPIERLAVPILDDGGFAEDHVLDLGDVRHVYEYILGEPEAEDDDKEKETCDEPEYDLLFLVPDCGGIS